MWLEPYTSSKAKYRAETKSDFEKYHHTFLNNSILGKTIQIN